MKIYALVFVFGSSHLRRLRSRRTRCLKAQVKHRRSRVCGTCHEAAKATSVKLTREGWIETLDRMKAFGAAGPDEDFAAVLEYLATHFKGDTVRPARHEHGRGDRSRKRAAAASAREQGRAGYRAKRGQFTSLDDLKALDPAIFKKIEARKDRIVFQTQR